MKPDVVKILGQPYTIEYVNNPAEVDLHKRESLWGQIDYWTNSIRIYDNGRPLISIWETIIHEVLHGIAAQLKLSELSKEENHNELDVLAVALIDTLVDNDWIILNDKKDKEDDMPNV